MNQHFVLLSWVKAIEDSRVNLSVQRQLYRAALSVDLHHVLLELGCRSQCALLNVLVRVRVGVVEKVLSSFRRLQRHVSNLVYSANLRREPPELLRDAIVVFRPPLSPTLRVEQRLRLVAVHLLGLGRSGQGPWRLVSQAVGRRCFCHTTTLLLNHATFQHGP